MTQIPASDYQFSTPHGLHLARKVLQPLLPYDPHDDQLEGICKMIDGIDLMALTCTGSGKTQYFTMYILLLLALSKDPRIVAPTKSLCLKTQLWSLFFQPNRVEEEMASWSRLASAISSRNSSNVFSITFTSYAHDQIHNYR